jgi:hypothetical protein
MLDALAPAARRRIYVSPQGGSRGAVDPAALDTRHPGIVAPSLPDALSAAQGAALVVVAGSLVLVGQARAILLGLPRDPPVAL